MATQVLLCSYIRADLGIKPTAPEQRTTAPGDGVLPLPLAAVDPAALLPPPPLLAVTLPAEALPPPADAPPLPELLPPPPPPLEAESPTWRSRRRSLPPCREKFQHRHMSCSCIQ